MYNYYMTILRALTVRQVAKLKNCHPHTVYRAIRRGDLPAEQVEGFMYFVRPTDAETWQPQAYNRRLDSDGENIVS
jgi:excisionase family DNA binding protein